MDSAASAPAEVVQTVKIGFAAPLTGPQAHYGKGYQNGVQMAIDDVNAETPTLGGKKVQFELLAEDDMSWLPCNPLSAAEAEARQADRARYADLLQEAQDDIQSLYSALS